MERVALPGEVRERLEALPALAPLRGALAGAGPLYLVGGAVRDLLRGGEPKDLDFVVEGDGTAVGRLLAAAVGAEVLEHERFGTAAFMSGEFAYDVAGARRERYPEPGALPEVGHALLAEDLLRRDFTVNALAVPLSGEPALLAVEDGLADLEAGQLRVLHERSFIDDPTRLLRMVRYAVRLGFAIEPGTAELAEQAIAGGALATVTRARVGAELRLLLAEREAPAMLGRLHALGIAEAIHPDLGGYTDLAPRALELLGDDGRADLVLLAADTRRIPPGELAELLTELGFRAVDVALAVHFAAHGERDARTLAAAVSPSEIAAALRGRMREEVALIGASGPAEPARRWLEELSRVELEIRGADLIAAGVPEGRAVGRGLEGALAAKLDGEAPDRDAELAVALAAARRPPA